MVQGDALTDPMDRPEPVTIPQGRLNQIEQTDRIMEDCDRESLKIGRLMEAYDIAQSDFSWRRFAVGVRDEITVGEFAGQPDLDLLRGLATAQPSAQTAIEFDSSGLMCTEREDRSSTANGHSRIPRRGG